MASILRSLRVLADPIRLRILLLVEREELSVAELQGVLSMGQSTISTHLGQLKQAGLVEDRRTGKNVLYRRAAHPGEEAGTTARLVDLLREASAEIPEAALDSKALQLVLRNREDRMRAHFDALAGKFGRQYVPGRSWQALTEAFLELLPPVVVADLGAGEGSVSQLLARRAKHVIAVDNSEKMVEYGQQLAAQHGLGNLEYRQGDLESLPIVESSVDVALFSQSLHHARHPDAAVKEAWRILKPGGRILVLDLLRHQLEEARELYADLWLGFTEVELQQFLISVGFECVRSAVVHRDAQPPNFQTVLAAGEKPVYDGGQK